MNEENTTAAMTAAVLCGGRSSRFGRPKEWLDFGGLPLLVHVIRTVRPLFSYVLAVGLPPPAPPQLPDVTCVPDAVPRSGPLGGIVTALQAARTQHTFFFACDSPFIHPNLVRAMQHYAGRADAIVPRSGPHYQPLFAIYSKDCLPAAEEQLKAGRFKISDIFSHLTIHFVDEPEQQDHDPQLLSFFNINTPADYDRALRLLQENPTSPS